MFSIHTQRQSIPRLEGNIMSSSFVSGEEHDCGSPPVVTSVLSTDHGIYAGTLDASAKAGRRPSNASVPAEDPNVRRVVYNLYRGLLANYNDKANDLISTLPPDQVCEDQGVTRHIESMM